MSMEMMKENKSKLAAEWSNIGGLYRIYMRQQRIHYLLAITAVITVLFTAVKNMVFETWDMVFVRGTDNGMAFILTGYILVSCGMACNILTNPAISMYPGTVKTRFLARVFYDYTVVILAGVIAALCNLGTIGCYKLSAAAGGNVYDEILFDGKTFCMRIVLWLSYMLLIYSAFILCHVIGTRVGDRVLMCLCGFVLAAAFLLWRSGHISWLMQAYRFYMDRDLGFGTALLRIFVTILILFVLSYMVMSTVHCWHEFSKVQLTVSLLLCYGAMGGIIFPMAMFEEPMEQGADIIVEIATSDLEEDITRGTVLVSDRIIKPGRVDAAALNDSYESTVVYDKTAYDSLFDIGFSVGWCELEKAKSDGLVDASCSLGQGEMLVRVVANNAYYGVQDKKEGQDSDNIPVLDRFITDLGIDIADSRYVVTLPKKMLVYDDFLSKLDLVFGSRAVAIDKEMDTAFRRTLECCQVYIIYRAEDMDSPELIRSYDLCEVSHTWYINEEDEIWE